MTPTMKVVEELNKPRSSEDKPLLLQLPRMWLVLGRLPNLVISSFKEKSWLNKSGKVNNLVGYSHLYYFFNAILQITAIWHCLVNVECLHTLTPSNSTSR